MQKTDFIARVAERTGTSRKLARQVVEAATEIIAEALEQDQKVVLTGFGTFELRGRQARRGVNPQTGEEMTIPAARLPGFSASNRLRERVRTHEQTRHIGQK